MKIFSQTQWKSPENLQSVLSVIKMDPESVAAEDLAAHLSAAIAADFGKERIDCSVANHDS